MLSSSILLPPSPNWYGAQLLAVQPEGGLAAYAGHNSVVVMCCHTGRVLRTMCAGPSRVTSLCWAPAAAGVNQLVAGHEDGSLRTWDARTGACLRSNKKKGPEVSALVLLPRQPAEALVGDVKGGLQLWAFQTGAKPRPFGTNLRSKVIQMVAIQAPPRSSPLPAAHTPSTSQPDLSHPPQAVSPSLVAAACADGTVNLIDLDAGVVVHCFSAHRGCIHALSGGQSSTTPGSLRSLGCVLLLTASGDEGTAKVWQVALSGRSPSVTLMSTLVMPGGRQDGPAGGRHSKQRSTHNQWLSACLLPICDPRLAAQPHVATQPVGAAAGVAKDQAWAALGLGTGEVWLHALHTDSGVVDAPVKLHNLHNRPIYSLMAINPTATHHDSLGQPDNVVAAGTAHEQDEGLTAEQAPAAGTADAGVLAAQPVESAAAAHEVDHVGRKSGSSAVLLVSISQDRAVVVTRVALKLGVAPANKPPTDKKRGIGKADAGAAAGTAGPGQAAGAPGQAGVSEAGHQGPADGTVHPGGSEPAVAAPPPPPSLHPTSDTRDVSVPVPAPDHPAVPETAPPAKAKAVVPTFRIAKGPPTDVNSDRGFHGGQNRRSASGSGAAEDTPPPPGATHGQDQQAAPPPVVPPPAALPAPVVPPSMQPRSSTAIPPDGTDAAQPASLQLLVSGYDVMCKIPGLGGYAHALCLGSQTKEGEASQGVGSAVAEVGPGGPAVVTCQVDRTWKVVVGCGDRTLRSAVFTWPASIRLAPHYMSGAGSEAAGAAVEAVGQSGAGEQRDITNDTAVPASATAGPASPDVDVATEVAQPEVAQPEVAQPSEAVPGAGAQAVKVSIRADQPTLLHSISMWKGLTDQVTCVKRHPRPSRFIAFGCQDGQVGVYDTTVQSAVLFPTRHQGPVAQLHWLAATYPVAPAVAPQAPTPSAATDEGASVVTDPAVVAPHGPVAVQTEAGVEGQAEQVTDEQVEAAAGVEEQQQQVLVEQQVEGGEGDGQVIVEPIHTGTPVKQGGGRQKASKARERANHKEEQLSAQHAVLQQWQLVSLGAEGRMLTWQLPSREDFAASAAGQQVLAGPHRSAAGAGDRAERWGVSSAAAATYANDFLVQLAACLPPGSLPHEPKSVTAMCTVPRTCDQHTGGDLLVLAITDEVVVLQAQPSGGGAASEQPGGRTSAAGAGQGQPAGKGAAGGGVQWQVVWRRRVAAGASSLLACVTPPSSPHTLYIACASISGIITCFTCDRTQPAAHVAPQGSSEQQQDDEGVLLGDRTKTISALTWLADGTALAAAYVQDASIHVWHMTQASPLATVEIFTDTPAATGHQGVPEASVNFESGSQLSRNPVLLVAIKGHTEQVTGLACDAFLASPLPVAAAPVRDQVQGVVLLMSCSRDQSVRAWVLDLPQLLQQAIQQQQQDAQQLELLQQQQQGEVEGEQQDGGGVAAAVSDVAPAVEKSVADEEQVTEVSGSVTTVQDQTADSCGTGVAGAAGGAAHVRSEIVGVPGGRAKGVRKAPVLAAKPILSQTPTTPGSSQTVAAARQEVLRLLGQRAGSEAVTQAVAQLSDPVALAAADLLPRAPEKQIITHVWSGDVRQALQVAITHSLLSADLVSVSASMGRAVWAAVSRLYAAQQEQVGQVHVAVMHLLAIGDRPAAAAAYRRVGLLQEAKAVEGYLPE